MSYPKIIFNPGGGAVTLNFTYPPVENAGVDANGADEYDAVRHDSTSLSGVTQKVLVRIDTFRNLSMKFVPDADVLAWAAFQQFALTGGSFAYYPDASLPTNFVYTQEDTTYSPKFSVRGLKSFTMKWRLAAS